MQVRSLLGAKSQTSCCNTTLNLALLRSSVVKRHPGSHSTTCIQAAALAHPPFSSSVRLRHGPVSAQVSLACLLPSPRVNKERAKHLYSVAFVHLPVTYGRFGDSTSSPRTSTVCPRSFFPCSLPPFPPTIPHGYVLGVPRSLGGASEVEGSREKHRGVVRPSSQYNQDVLDNMLHTIRFGMPVLGTVEGWSVGHSGNFTGVC